ncbi:hypothetical protein EVAR_61543_1 [Eumeta japonica]|uniref:Uncharacterized protein n=1 Tax=Eumeta variegata TaxID=151549 RepID=A0A4C1Z6U7_EUMVA|nr:hypothetical protein EVAR_61543_1 [Eumeta japonica]
MQLVQIWKLFDPEVLRRAIKSGPYRWKYRQHHLDGRRFTTVLFMRNLLARSVELWNDLSFPTNFDNGDIEEKSVFLFKRPAMHNRLLRSCGCPWVAVTIYSSTTRLPLRDPIKKTLYRSLTFQKQSKQLLYRVHGDAPQSSLP